MIVALDEHGKSMGSEAFAALLARWRDEGKPAVSFLIGGADGLDPELLNAGALALSFSPLTWPHQLVRIMLAEQLYRATTILAGHPYHRA
jgi:23S rRNA (pseudouridine1915-N3)-methyltransferase